MVYYDSYINSPDWDSVRREVLDRAKGHCERCGARDRLEVHHKHYDTLGNEDLDDLEALCGNCHSDADDERVESAEEDRMERRFQAWAAAAYGDDWELSIEEDDMRERFDRFLEEND